MRHSSNGRSEEAEKRIGQYDDIKQRIVPSALSPLRGKA
jgi:hypothetical protein